jgi:hypothetical protein
MLTSGIFRERGNKYVVNNNLVPGLNRRLHPTIVIHTTRAKLQQNNYQNHFISLSTNSSNTQCTISNDSSNLPQMPADCRVRHR